MVGRLAGKISRRRRPERSVTYRALADPFERFLQVYEDRFEPDLARRIRVWSVPDGEPLRTVPAMLGWLAMGGTAGGDRLITASVDEGRAADDGRVRLEAWSLQSGESKLLAHVRRMRTVEPRGRWLAHVDQEGDIWMVSLDELSTWPGRPVGRHEGGVPQLSFDPDGERFSSAN